MSKLDYLRPNFQWNIPISMNTWKINMFEKTSEITISLQYRICDYFMKPTELETICKTQKYTSNKLFKPPNSPITKLGWSIITFSIVKYEV